MSEVKATITKVKKRISKNCIDNDEDAFVFCYGAGHGVADQMQYMVFNGTSGNLFKIENNLRDLCSNMVSKQKCKVFAVFDMCKDIKSKYEDILTMN